MDPIKRIENIYEWNYIINEFYKHNNNLKILKVENLIKILLNMWMRNDGAFSEFEESLIEDLYITKNNTLDLDYLPQSKELLYTYKLCEFTVKNFKENLCKLFESYKLSTGFITSLSARNFIDLDILNLNIDIYRNEKFGLALKDIKNNNQRICTGGCSFKLYDSEKNYYDMSVTRKYRTRITLRLPFMASTNMNITLNTPKFPLGKVCGRYKRLKLDKGDLEGGLRVEGKFKSNSDEMPLITYITVVYNRKNSILRCMESVWAQSYPNIEYIIIDGKSQDGTLDVIKEHADKIDYYVSQTDTGIYNAMNKGLSLATGEFICFMNSDDICTPNAASAVVECYRETKADLVSGWINIRSVEGKISEPRGIERKCICNNVMRYEGIYHQSLYAKTEVYEKIGYFDETYRGASDLKWLNDCKNNKFNIKLISEVLAIFSMGGFSDENKINTVNETCRIFLEQYPELNEKISKQLYYLYKRQGITRRELFPAYKKLKTLIKNNYSLRKWMYEISLYMVIEELKMIINKYKNDVKCDSWLSSKLLKNSYCKRDGQVITNVIELCKFFEGELDESISDLRVDKITLKDIKSICSLKRLINNYERKKIYNLQYKNKFWIFKAQYNYIKDKIKEKFRYESLGKMSKYLENNHIKGV